MGSLDMFPDSAVRHILDNAILRHQPWEPAPALPPFAPWPVPLAEQEIPGVGQE